VTYAVGQRVLIADRRHDGHHRTPGYVKGRSGTVERLHASFPNPESRAYGGDGLPKRQLYMVALDYEGERVLLDVFEHWLEAAP